MLLHSSSWWPRQFHDPVRCYGKLIALNLLKYSHLPFSEMWCRIETIKGNICWSFFVGFPPVQPISAQLFLGFSKANAALKHLPWWPSLIWWVFVRLSLRVRLNWLCFLYSPISRSVISGLGLDSGWTGGNQPKLIKHTRIRSFDEIGWILEGKLRIAWKHAVYYLIILVAIKQHS